MTSIQTLDIKQVALSSLKTDTASRYNGFVLISQTLICST